MFIFLKSKKTGHCIQSVNKDTTIVLEVRGALLVACVSPRAPGRASLCPQVPPPPGPKVSLWGWGLGGGPWGIGVQQLRCSPCMLGEEGWVWDGPIPVPFVPHPILCKESETPQAAHPPGGGLFAPARLGLPPPNALSDPTPPVQHTAV